MAKKDAGIRSYQSAKLDDDDFVKYQFELDGHTYTGETDVEGRAFAMIITADRGDYISEVIKFFDNTLKPADARRLSHKLRDPRDGFSISTLVDIIRGVMEDVAGRPTESQPD